MYSITMAKKQTRRANPKNMKKTTSKGAYKPNRKKQMVIRRAPVVESKKDERYEWTGKGYIDAGPGLSVYTDNLLFRDLTIGDNPSGADPAVPQHLVGDIPHTFLYRTQGFGATDMVGESVFVKYLKMKFEFKLPADSGLIHFPQCQMYLVHGFVNKSIDANEFTTPTLTALTRANISEYVIDQIDQYFENGNEPMRYQPKGRNFSSIKILGKKEIRWNKNKSILPDPVRSGASATDQWGELPTKIVDCEWPMMKKVRYERGPQFSPASGAQGSDPRQNNYFVNSTDQLPFWAVYMPGGDNIIYGTETNRIQFRHNDVCYYTDS